MIVFLLHILRIFPTNISCIYFYAIVFVIFCTNNLDKEALLSVNNITFTHIFVKRTNCISIAFKSNRIVCTVSFEFSKIFI